MPKHKNRGTAFTKEEIVMVATLWDDKSVPEIAVELNRGVAAIMRIVEALRKEGYFCCLRKQEKVILSSLLKKHSKKCLRE
jgi:biotin operon repressor